MATKIKLNSPGIRALLSSMEMKSAIGAVASGEGTITKSFICGDRVDFIVKTGGKNADRSKGDRSSKN